MGIPWELAEAIEELAAGIKPRALAEASRDLSGGYRDRAAEARFPAGRSGGPAMSTDSRPRKAAEDLERVDPAGGRPVSIDSSPRAVSEHVRRAGGPSPPPVSSDAHRAAYAVVRLPATFAASSAALGAVAERLPHWTPLRLLDLGAGPATAAWGACDLFPGLESISLVERDPGFIALGSRLASRSSHAALREAWWMPLDLAALSVSRSPAPSTSPVLPSADLVICCYALNEISPSAHAGLLDAAWEATGGVLLLVEPGTPDGFAGILAARAHLIARGGRVVAPCPHDRGCPLADGPEWCHFSERLERTRRHRMAKDAALGFEDEKYSYVAVARSGLLSAPPGEKVGGGGRIIDRPTIAKGGVTLPLCAAFGLEDRTVSRRDKEAFRRARKARWGDWWEF